MTQGQIDWTRDVSLPVSGRSVEARHASSTGAQVAVRSRGKVASAYRDLLMSCGPLSDHEAARLLGRLVSSVNSTRNAFGDRVVPSGQFEATDWGSRRVRWQWQER